MSNTTSFVIVEKNGDLKTSKVKDFRLEDLYRKCGFKKQEGFNVIQTYEIELRPNETHSDVDDIQVASIIKLYGKQEGRGGNENKHDFPSVNDLIFGTCALVGFNSVGDVIQFTKEEWRRIEEQINGGYEDLDATAEADENEEDELDGIPDELKTKEGYLKDGFVVDDVLEEEEYHYDNY
jgi:hypothetical protein